MLPPAAEAGNEGGKVRFHYQLVHPGGIAGAPHPTLKEALFIAECGGNVHHGYNIVVPHKKCSHTKEWGCTIVMFVPNKAR